jgi:hypothetical protein
MSLLTPENHFSDRLFNFWSPTETDRRKRKERKRKNKGEKDGKEKMERKR